MCADPAGIAHTPVKYRQSVWLPHLRHSFLAIHIAGYDEGCWFVDLWYKPWVSMRSLKPWWKLSLYKNAKQSNCIVSRATPNGWNWNAVCRSYIALYCKSSCSGFIGSMRIRKVWSTAERHVWKLWIRGKFQVTWMPQSRMVSRNPTGTKWEMSQKLFHLWW